MMKRCRTCQQPAAIILPASGGKFCAEHFLDFFRNKVKRTNLKYKLINPHERIGVALSGGKDSAVLMHVLDDLYVETLDLIGIHVNLGIHTTSYSARSHQLSKALCDKLGREFICIDLKKEFQMSMDLVKERENQIARSLCGTCGTIKRYLLNRYALALDCEKLATGHVLDDEVSVLFMNMFSGKINQLIRMGPCLPTMSEHMISRIKPLYELSESETTSYAQLVGLETQDEECPYAKGATTLKYKKLFSEFEKRTPGVRYGFIHNYINRILPALTAYYHRPEDLALKTCEECHGPTTESLCAFCTLRTVLTKED